jgi:stage II sporulation protein D
MRSRRVALTLLLAAAISTLSAPSPAQESRFGAAAAPVRLVPTSSQPISVSGLPSFFGTIELGAFSDGIAVTNDIEFERYLLGLNEVPVGWPMEALKAQAVAARTYAMWTLGRPRAGTAAIYGFDICATVQCQVFSGADVVSLEGGERWIEAVRETRGQAVLFGGDPILARYHSTSGGATLDNPQAFPGEVDYPYLQGVSSTTEKGAPLYRWRTSFTLPQLQLILERSGVWQGRFRRLMNVQLQPSNSGLHYPDVVFIGKKGRTRMTAEEWREIVRDLAPALFPGQYPSAAPTSSGVLPETFPSNRLARVSVRDGVVEIVGRGWGHGVGMSQWGAEGLARRGFDHIDILGHYYSGVSVGPHPVPERIRVGVATSLDTVTVTGAFKILDASGRTLAPDALGTWVFSYGGAGAIGIQPPPGYNLPLRIGVVKPPKRVAVGARTTLRITLSRPARVNVVGGPRVASTDPVVRAAGKRELSWKAPKEPGTYTISVAATARGTKRRSEPFKVEVWEPQERSADSSQAEEPDESAKPPAESASAEEGDDVGVLALITLVFLVLVAVATGVVAARIDRWAKQPPQA